MVGTRKRETSCRLLRVRTAKGRGQTLQCIKTGKYTLMSTDFWNIVEAAKVKAGDNVDARPNALKSILITLSPDAIVAFDLEYGKRLIESYTWALWGAAYLASGGCSDDGFDYFRDFLISEGQQVFEAAIKNPDSLAALDNIEEAELEQYRYSIYEAYEESTGAEMPINALTFPADPVGDEWEEDDLEAMFPNLAAKYG